MKKHFGEHTFHVRGLAAQDGMTIDRVIMEAQADYDALKLPAEHPTKRHYYTNVLALQAERHILLGEATHYFIETEELAKALPLFVREWEPSFTETIFEHNRYGVIHTCGENAMAVCFSFSSRKDGVLVAFSDSILVPWYGKLRSAHEPENLASAAPILDLVFGLGLYLKCFPHALKDGFPECAKHPAHYKGSRCAAVGAVPEITERSGPIPHFRHGHFRVLSSPRFTHKRNQVIFVRETFVHGAVKTVTEVKEAK